MAIESGADFVRMTRGALAASGFVRQERGGAVWWTKDAASREDGLREPLSPGLGGEGGRRPGEGRTRETEHKGDPSSALRAPSPLCGGEKGSQIDKPATIVLLHGANDHAGTWFTVAPVLAANYRVILPDLAGHGESAPAAGPIPISLIVSQLETILRDEPAFTLAGNSLGGWIALLYALRNPDRVTRLFLEASGGLERPLAVPLTAKTREEASVILKAVHGPKFQAPEWVIQALLDRADDSPMLRLTEVAEHNIEPHLGEIRVPARLIWGADDGVVPLSYGEALRDAIPGATMCVIEGAAHIPHVQQPQRFLECLTPIS